MLQEINEQILLKLNSLTNLEFIENMVYIFADAPIFFLPIFLVVTRIYISYYEKNNCQKKWNLLLIFNACFISIILAITIQSFVSIDRPETVIENSWKLLLKHLPDASFPSDHATVSFAFLAWLFLSWYKKIGLLFLPFVILMNLSRVIAWIHWPFDIIAWLIIWVASAKVSFTYLKENKFVKKVNLWIIKMISLFKL